MLSLIGFRFDVIRSWASLFMEANSLELLKLMTLILILNNFMHAPPTERFDRIEFILIRLFVCAFFNFTDPKHDLCVSQILPNNFPCNWWSEQRFMQELHFNDSMPSDSLSMSVRQSVWFGRIIWYLLLLTKSWRKRSRKWSYNMVAYHSFRSISILIEWFLKPNSSVKTKHAISIY